MGGDRRGLLTPWTVGCTYPPVVAARHRVDAEVAVSALARRSFEPGLPERVPEAAKRNPSAEVRATVEKALREEPE